MIINNKTHLPFAGMWFSVEILITYAYAESPSMLHTKKNMNPKAMVMLQFE